MNRPITSNTIESVILKRSYQQLKSLGADSFTSEFYWTFNKDLTPILLQKVEEDGTLLRSNYEANITLISKTKDKTKKIKGQYHWEHRCKSSIKY